MMNATARSKSLPKQLHAIPQSHLVQLEECFFDDANSYAAHDLHGWLGYRRWREFDNIAESKGIGQDNAALRSDAHYVVGVLCDGVSQGFYGNIAATILTDALIERLWETRISPPDAKTMQAWLIEIEAEISLAVGRWNIPSHLPKMQQELLEETRTKTGSQTVFTAFIWDRQATNANNSGGHLHAYQVGDPFLYAYLHAECNSDALASHWEMIPNPNFDQFTYRLLASPRGRVRSIGKSKLHLAYGCLKGVQGVVLHSDGIPPEWGATLANLDVYSTQNETSVKKKVLLENWMELDWADKDDVSFVVALASPLQAQLMSHDAVSTLPVLPFRPASPVDSPVLISQPTPATTVAETMQIASVVPAIEGITEIPIADQPTLSTEEPIKQSKSARLYQQHKTKAASGPTRLNTTMVIALVALLLAGTSVVFSLRNLQDNSVSTVQKGSLSSTNPETQTEAVKPPPPPPINLKQRQGIIHALKALNRWKSDTYDTNVRAYQAEKGLTVDGDPGEQTRAKLAEDLDKIDRRFIR